MFYIKRYKKELSRILPNYKQASNTISVLIYVRVWQRPDGREETGDDQHAAGWNNGQLDRQTGEPRANNCF